MAKIVDEVLDFLQFHSVYGFSIASWRHGSVVGVQTGVGAQVERRIVQESVHVL
jgi:hypothetical protein